MGSCSFDPALVASPFWSQALANFVGSAGGALLGVLAAFWLTRRHDQGRERKEEGDLLLAAERALTDNLELIRQLFDATNDPEGTPTYAMDPGLLDALLPRLVLICRDAELLHELNQFRYQLHHLNRKVDLWFEWEQVRFGPSAARQERRGDLMNSIRESISMLRKSGQDRLPQLFEARLKQLASPTHHVVERTYR